MTNETLQEAAKFFLKFSGQKGTQKQIDKLLKQVGESVLRMAVARGFKPFTLKNVGAPNSEARAKQEKINAAFVALGSK